MLLGDEEEETDLKVLGLYASLFLGLNAFGVSMASPFLGLNAFGVSMASPFLIVSMFHV